MSQTLYVNGKMYEANTVTLSDEELKGLLSALEKDEDEDFWEDLEDLHERLMDDSEVNGFWVSEGVPLFEASVDEQVIPFSSLDLSYEESKTASGEKPKLKKAVLVFEKWSNRGCLCCELDEEFDKEALDLSATAYTLPTGEIRYVVEPYYEDHDFEFQDSWTDAECVYIVTAEGEVINLDRASDS